MTKDDAQQLVKASRRLSHCLRHSPETYGVVLASDGSASVSEVCQAMNLTEEDLQSIVESDSKGRFVLRDGRIWAAQGHTVKVDVPMEDFTSFDVLFHGTKKESVESIMREGLIPRQRLHVHLSTTVEAATDVASRRNGDSVILQIDTVKLLESGVSLKVSENGVVLAEFVPPEFITVSTGQTGN